MVNRIFSNGVGIISLRKERLEVKSSGSIMLLRNLPTLVLVSCLSVEVSSSIAIPTVLPGQSGG